MPATKSFRECFAELERSFPRSLAVERARSLSGEVAAPTSKSYTHRAIMVAGLSEGATIEQPLVCTDTERTVAVWEALGARVDYDDAAATMRVRGFAGRPRLATDVLDVHESGTLFRLVLPGLALHAGTVTVTGNESFQRRANDVVVAPLRDLGVEVAGRGPGHCAPVLVRGTGRLRPGVARVPGGKSSQAVSGLLLWLPLATADDPSERSASEIRIEGEPVSMPYVRMTLEMLAWAGVEAEEVDPTRYRVPSDQRYACPATPYRVRGDYSSAAFLLAAACLVPSDVVVTNLLEDEQGDRRIVDVLRAMGARIDREGDAYRVRGPAPLTGITVDCSATPDLVPILAAVGAHARGHTVLTNLLHLRNKESDRITGPVSQLGRLGAKIDEGPSEIRIEGGTLHGGDVDALNDHRIAMALAVAALPVGGVRIGGTAAILKSYPAFVRHLGTLGARVTGSAQRTTNGAA